MKNLVYILLLICLNANAADVYLSANGSGNNSGINNLNYKPFASFPSVGAGDNVYLKRGDVYNGTIPGYSGASGNPLTMSATGTGANPIINGFTTLTSWTLSSGNIYYATLSFAELHGITLNGVFQKRGRYPNTGYLTYTSHTNTSITGTTIGSLPANYVGGEVVMKKLRWILDRNTITAQSGNTITFSTSSSYGGNSATPVDGRGYFIQNALSTLDQLGEWYYDHSASRLYMHFGTGTPTGRTVKAATTAQLLTQGGGYVTYNNIDFEGGNYGAVLSSATNITFNSCNFRQQAGMGVYAITTNIITFSGGSISGAQNAGFFGEYNLATTLLENMAISNNGMVPGMGQSGDASYSGIFLNGSSTTIRGCTVTNSGYQGIAFIGDNVLIEKNKIDNFNSVKDDGGGIYTVITNSGVTATNRVIDRNIVLNGIGSVDGTGGANSEASGIYLDDYSNNTTVSNNIISTGTFNGIMLNGGHTNTVINNTVYDYPNQLGFFVYQSNGSRYVRNMIVTGNKFISRTASQNALFVNQQENEASTLWGTINNNYYARPISEASTIGWRKWNFYAGAPDNTTYYTVAGWNTASSQDANSFASQVTTASLSNIRFDYNYAASASTVSVGAVYKGVDNTTYTGSIPLAAYGGVVSVYFSDLSPEPPTVPPPASGQRIRTRNGKFLLHNGKIITSGTPASVITSVVTNQTIGTLRNNYSDFVGFAFYVGPSPITVTSLGRWITSGNTGSHTLRIVDYATGATVVSTTINTNGMAANAFGYATCTPTVLSANVRYAILSLEVNGGDFWGNEASITVTSAINTVRSAYIDGSGLNTSSTQDVSYVPLNFRY